MKIHQSNSPFTRNFRAVLLIGALAAVLYAGALDNQFTNWDDNSLIVHNRQIRSLSLKSVMDIFDYKSGGTYQPLRELSYAIDYHFFKLNPRGYIFHSILLHALASIFLYLSLVIMLPRIKGLEHHTGMADEYPALLAALVFAVHPVNCEAVVWLSGRKYVLFAFFSFLSIYLYALGTQDSRTRIPLLAGAVICIILAALSSPFGVVLPVLLMVYDYSTQASASPVQLIKKNKARYLLFSLGGCVLAWALLNKLVAFFLSDAASAASVDHYLGNPWLTFWTTLRVLFDYMKNLIFPFDLNNRYPDIIAMSVFRWKVIFSMAGIGVLTFFLVRQLNKGSKVLFFCTAWFFVFWLPASNLIPISTKMADRYIYAASPGVFLLMSLALTRLAEKQRHFRPVTVKISVCVFLIAYLALFTVPRSMVWESSQTLWADSLKKDPANFVAQNNLGAHLLRVEKNPGDALPYLERALELAPDQEKPVVYKNYCTALFFSGKYDQTIQCLKSHIQLRPEDVTLYNTLGNLYFKLGRYPEALDSYDAAAGIRPDQADALYNGAVSLEAMGKAPDARKRYEQVLALDPDHFNALNRLGNICMSMGQPDLAVRLFQKALEIDPGAGFVNFNLGLAFKNNGQPDKAIDYFSQALEHSPEDTEAMFLLARSLVDTGRKDAARPFLKKVCELDPDFEEARQLLIAIEKINER